MTSRRSALGGEDEGAETNGKAIASLGLAIVWLFGVGSVIALVLGYMSLKEIAASEGREGGRVIAIAGLIVAVAGLGSLALVIAFALSAS